MRLTELRLQMLIYQLLPHCCWTMQVTSRLHRQQITRAIKRLMLGLGQAPSAPQVCSSTCLPSTKCHERLLVHDQSCCLHAILCFFFGLPAYAQLTLSSLLHLAVLMQMTPAGTASSPPLIMPHSMLEQCVRTGPGLSASDMQHCAAGLGAAGAAGTSAHAQVQARAAAAARHWCSLRSGPACAAGALGHLQRRAGR